MMEIVYHIPGKDAMVFRYFMISYLEIRIYPLSVDTARGLFL